MSESDIHTGARWANVIADELERAQLGIFCLTPESHHSPWLLFEAGALSKTVQDAFVIPYVLDMSVSDIDGPLSQFQASVCDRSGTARVLQTVNSALGDRALDLDTLASAFEMWWPKLEADLAGTPPAPIAIEKRDVGDMVREVLELVRESSRRPSITRVTARKLADMPRNNDSPSGTPQLIQFRQVMRLLNETQTISHFELFRALPDLDADVLDVVIRRGWVEVRGDEEMAEYVFTPSGKQALARF